MEYQQIMAVHVSGMFFSTLPWGVGTDACLVGGWSFGTLLGPEITGPVVSGSFWGAWCGWFCCFWFPAHGLSFALVRQLLWGWCGVGGGCDGVVVWELYSGREHLVRRDEIGW